MKRFVLGDVHGNHKALLQVIDRSGIDKNDLLIFLGDVVDGYPDVKECIETLLEFKNLVFIMGNHDAWFSEFLTQNVRHPYWVNQGGYSTLISYGNTIKIPMKHRELFVLKYNPYFVLDNMLFVHGGYNPFRKIEEQHIDDLMWDRNLFNVAINDSENIFGNVSNETVIDNILYDRVFIGHTFVDDVKPFISEKIVNLDTGAGWKGVLTLMNIDNVNEYYQSDAASELYPNFNDKGPRIKLSYIDIINLNTGIV